jgi:hypothetical protein
VPGKLAHQGARRAAAYVQMQRRGRSSRERRRRAGAAGDNDDNNTKYMVGSSKQKKIYVEPVRQALGKTGAERCCCLGEDKREVDGRRKPTTTHGMGREKPKATGADVRVRW